MDDRLTSLYVAVAKQALKDFKAGYHSQRHMSARRWLQLAGLLTDDGELARGVTERRSASKLPVDPEPVPAGSDRS